ncbi:diguanylate cyclase domain-containing protein [Aquimonas sp.]|uniref:diguanylate cyclase domain-containing protein n=1 Tax=Aquimonas sp. TaxID=1872588 RepID=UPI0037BECE81
MAPARKLGLRKRLSLLGMLLCLALAPAVLAQPSVDPAAALSAEDAAVLAEAERLEDSAIRDFGEAAATMQALAERASETSPLRRELLAIAGRWYANAELHEAAEALADQLDARAQQLGDGSDLAASLVRLRVLALAQGAAMSLEQMRALKPRIERELGPRERLRYWYNLANNLRAAGELAEAIAAFQAATELADANNSASWRALVRSGLAESLAAFGQQHRAEALVREAVEIALALGDDLLLSDVYSTLGVVLEQGGDTEGLLAAMTLAISHARSAGDNTNLAVLLGNVAHYHLVRTEYEQAERVSLEALDVAERNEDRTGRALANINLGLARIGLGQIDAGKQLVRRGLDEDESRGQRSEAALTYAELGAALERAGDLTGAVEAYHSARRLDDEIFREDQQRAVLALQEQIDARRRDKAIEQLQAEDARKAAQLERNQLQQWVWRLLALLLVMALIVLIAGVRRLRQSNRKLAGVNAQLRLQSERDALTGLANRRHVQAVIKLSGGERTYRGSLYLIDLDHFKSINDRHGHAVGDAVLIEVSRRLRGLCRGEDLAARWGGEEFLLAVEWLAPADAARLAERILHELSRAVQHEDLRIPISASIGFASLPLPPAALELSFEQSLRLIDSALYLAKLRGRNRACGIRWVRDGSGQAVEATVADIEHAEALGRIGLETIIGAGE